MNTRLKAAVVGCGAGGALSLQALRQSSRYELIAAADLNPNVLATLRAQYPGLQTFTSHAEMFRACPLDVVCVSTYAPTHEAITMDAIASNPLRGLLVEKPLGDTAAAGRRIVAAIKKAALPVVVPHGMMASNPGLEVVSIVRQGAVGKVNLVEFQCSRMDIINAGIHLLHYFVSLTAGEAMDYVLAACESSTRTFRDGMQVETTAITYGQTRSGIRLVLNSGDEVLITYPGAGHLIRIVGSGGLVEFRKADAGYRILNEKYPGGMVITPEALKCAGHLRYLEQLAGMIEQRKPDYRMAESSLMALEIVEAAYLSSRRQCKVTFPLADFAAPEKSNWDPGLPYGGSGGGRNGKTL